MINNDNMLSYQDRITPEYVAGLFDGEGCVSASFNNNGNMRLRVTITQKNPCILYLVLMKFSGTIAEHKSKNSRWHSITWTGTTCVKFLEYIKDHVIIKHDLVENGLKLAQLFHYNTAYKSSMTQIIMKEREELMRRICELNASNRGEIAIN